MVLIVLNSSTVDNALCWIPVSTVSCIWIMQALCWIVEMVSVTRSPYMKGMPSHMQSSVSIWQAATSLMP